MDSHIRSGFLQLMQDIVGEEYVLTHENMADHTTFRVGGPADYLVVPHSADEVVSVYCLCREEKIPVHILGNGSNVLVSEEGVRGVVIKVADNMSEYSVDEETGMLTAESGARLTKCAAAACDAGLTGLEFASGIPGTIGGGVSMNCGAYGGEIADVVVWAKVVDESGDAFRLSRKKLDFGYRQSAIAKNHYVVLEVGLELEKGDPETIRKTMQDYNRRRREKQPLDYPSAGSTFKRPEGHYAGALIEEAGMKGYAIGGAKVSEKHAGFIINTGNATPSDIANLISVVQQRVREKTGVDLEPEVKLWK